MLQPPASPIIPSTEYSQKRPLRAGAEILVKVGQAVRPETPVARISLPTTTVNVPAGSLLGVREEDLARCLVKQVGDTVKEGDVVARKGGILGGKREAFAPAAGVIDLVQYDTGEIIIARPRETEVVLAETIGQVTEILPGRDLTVTTQAAVVEAILGVGEPICGMLRVVATDPNEELSEDTVSGDHRDCVLVGGVIAREQVMAVAKSMGAVGLIAGGTPAARHESWLGARPAVPLTLALTEGFGASGMHGYVFSLFKKWEGQPTLIFRQNNGRARIVIRLPEGTPMVPSTTPTIGRGSLVRIVRRPYFGAEGRVVAIPPFPLLLPSGLVAPAARVELADRSVVTVPLYNLELIG